ncbi:MAG: hypothetical protein ACFFEN_15750 [Candidatus Thorarchaeota archaeon]
MAELSKAAKIMLLVNAIVSFIFTVFYLVIPEIYRDLTGPPQFCSITIRHVGGSLLVLGVFSVVGVIRKEWEQVRIVWELGILWLIVILCIDIWAMVVVAGSFDFTVIIEVILIVANLVFYIRERR